MTAERDASLMRLLRIEFALAELGADELRVAELVVQRLALGQERYGLLDIARDRRDWRKEALEEHIDAVIYTAIQGVKDGDELQAE